MLLQFCKNWNRVGSTPSHSPRERQFIVLCGLAALVTLKYKSSWLAGGDAVSSWVEATHEGQGYVCEDCGGSRMTKRQTWVRRKLDIFNSVVCGAACLFCSTQRIWHPSASKTIDVSDLTLGKIGGELSKCFLSWFLGVSLAYHFYCVRNGRMLPQQTEDCLTHCLCSVLCLSQAETALKGQGTLTFWFCVLE